MGALPRPALAPGPHRELIDALHSLHHRAGWPSLRVLARDASCSHTTVSHVFSSPKLPSWGTVELLVEAMGGSTTDFHQLWLAASTPDGEAPPAAPAIAGRRAELDVVRRHLETGTGLLLVTGEAGMGKTKLVTMAVEQIDTLVASGHCLPLSSEVPLLAIGDVLRGSYSVNGGRWLRESLDHCPEYVATAIAPLVPGLQAPEESDHEADEWSSQRLFTAVGATLAALAATGPAAFVIEDLHWADPSTLDLLTHVFAAGVECAVVGTWRLDDDATPVGHVEWFERISRLGSVRRLELSSLTEDETAHQLSLLGVDPGGEVAARVFRRTQGQPLFTEQLASTVHDGAELPRMLADLLDRRFDGLSETAWSLARVLGVADRPLRADQLAAATHATSAHLERDLRDLQRHRLVRTTRFGSAELHHPLLAEAVRRQLVAGEASQVHRAIAEVLGAEPDASAAEVATHWQGADDPEQEIAWRIAAARSSAAGLAAAMEAEQWLRAFEIWPAALVSTGTPPVTRAGTYLAAIDALKFSMQFDRAAKMCAEAESRLGDIDVATRADLLRQDADFRAVVEGTDVGLALIEESLAAYRTLPVSIGMVHAYDRKHSLLQACGRFAEAFDLAREAADVAAEVGDARTHRFMLSRVARHEGFNESIERAMHTMARAEALVPAGSDPRGDIWQAVMLTDLLLLTGGSAGAIEKAGHAGLAVAEKWGIETFPALLVRSNVMLALIREGRLDDAADLVDSVPDGPLDLDRWVLHLDRALVEGLRGHGDRAKERITALVEGLGPQTIGADLEFWAEVATVLVWNGAAADAWRQILPALDEMVDSAPAGPIRPALLLAARAAGDLAAADASVAPGHLDTLLKLHARLPSPEAYGQRLLPTYDRALTHGWQAELARLDGTATVERWVAAASAWDKLTRPHDAAYCRWRGAQVALATGQAGLAQKLLRRAATDAREHVPLSEAIAATRASP